MLLFLRHLLINVFSFLIMKPSFSFSIFDNSIVGGEGFVDPGSSHKEN
jgi:hypothetical protein